MALADDLQNTVSGYLAGDLCASRPSTYAPAHVSDDPAPRVRSAYAWPKEQH